MIQVYALTNPRECPELRPTYTSWSGMQSRCHCPGDQAFELYGARGIRVCERWRASFEAFIEDMGLRPGGLSLDRIDSDGNYEPGNCRWTTAAIQRSNQRPRLAGRPRQRNTCSLCNTDGHTKRTCLIWRDVPACAAPRECLPSRPC